MKVTKRNRETILVLIWFLIAGSLFQIDQIIKIAKSGDKLIFTQQASVASALSRNAFMRGDTSVTVRRVQRALTNLGLYQGAVNGTFDNQTERAVRTYQRLHTLSVNGMLDQATVTSILNNQ
jgi:peptidoglycan hydrolase-like protein with peptidoglycan-binding domain